MPIRWPWALPTVLPPEIFTTPSLALSKNDCSATWAVPPMWNVRMVSRVPGSPMDRAAMTPTASTDVHQGPAGQIAAVAGAADADLGLAGQHRTDLHRLDGRGLDEIAHVLVQIGAGRYDHFAGVGVLDVFRGEAAEDPKARRDADHRLRPARSGAYPAWCRSLPRYCRCQSCATSTRRRVEWPELAVFSAVSARPLQAPWVELKYSWTVRRCRVRDDRRLDDLAGQLGHQAAHPAELLRTGLRTAAELLIMKIELISPSRPRRLSPRWPRGHHLVGDPVRSLGPGVGHLVVLRPW